MTATLPYPPTDGTTIRIFSLIKSLAPRHKISVASFATSSSGPEAIEVLRSYCKEVRVVPRKPGYPLTKLIKGLIGYPPFPILNYWDPAMVRAIRKMFQSTTFDIVQAEALHVAQYCEGIQACSILDLFDILSVVMKRYAKQEHKAFRRTYARVTAPKLARYEEMICPRFTECLVTSPDDQHVLRKQMGLEHVSIIPNGVDLKGYTPGNGKDVKDNRIVFVGRMDYPGNDDGVQWFCREVLPLVRAQRPDAIFQIVGKNPTKEVRALAIPSQIEVTGFVEDVRSYIEAAPICVIPLRVGGGTRLKLLEAFAMGKAVVSTSVGAEGLAVTPERDILIADNPEMFAKQILRLLQNRELREYLGVAGRRLVERCYGWDAIGQRLEGVYEEALRNWDSNGSLEF